MEIEEYDVSFLVIMPNKQLHKIVTYVCLSKEHFNRNPTLNREEVILKNGLFLLTDRYNIKPESVISVVNYKPVELMKGIF
ncbi:hypothetical protein [Calidifontibacillus oryziterrae]|uniref:hypothetical protein n=1 Tax=Calidifontibacillus oryziterrae TaxID=1191699 RepID=UPI0002D84E32|nr:hypothetical protein [Calidifontibacillus oryziterrae]